MKIPTQLRSVTGGEAEAQIEEAGTVGEVLDVALEPAPVPGVPA